MNPELWHRAAVIGWLAFFGLFMGIDALVWTMKDKRVPTFSRVVCGLIPWYVVLPLVVILFVHFLLIYLEK